MGNGKCSSFASLAEAILGAKYNVYNVKVKKCIIMVFCIQNLHLGRYISCTVGLKRYIS